MYIPGSSLLFLLWRITAKIFLVQENSTTTSNAFITGRNEVLAKVIFSQACVCPREGGCASKFSGGVPFWEGASKFSGGGASKFSGGGASKFSGGVPPNFRGVPPNFRGGGVPFWGVPFWGGGPSPEYGQRSAGTHPTGMHSCLC